MRGYPSLGGPYNKDYSILRSMLGSPYVGKLPHSVVAKVWGSGLGFSIIMLEMN